MIGYLKDTLGQHTILEMPEPGRGLIVKTLETRWLLETFSHSDWSGSKSTRRSTSSAIHMVNGVVVMTSSRGQKSVSLSSAEAELNALVSAAADGIYVRRCLEFLVDEMVEHVSHKRGPGKLRHIDGKLLWIQDLVAQKTLNVKPIGTVYYIADLGTKPLTKARIHLILYWCNTYNGQGRRIGQDEHDGLTEGNASRSSVKRLSKFLHRIMLLEGLKRVAGERIYVETDNNTPENSRWTIVSMMLL